MPIECIESRPDVLGPAYVEGNNLDTQCDGCRLNFVNFQTRLEELPTVATTAVLGLPVCGC
jgi:hypothetical protein